MKPNIEELRKKYMDNPPEGMTSKHEHTKLHLEMYAKNNNQPLVKPFILIVCKSIQHATETFNRIYWLPL